jgi:hypothetical protein
MADTVAAPGGGGSLAPSKLHESRPTTSIPVGRDSGFTEQEEDEMIAAELGDQASVRREERAEHSGPSDEEAARHGSAGLHSKASMVASGAVDTHGDGASMKQRTKVVSIVLHTDARAEEAEWSVEIPGAVNSMEDSDTVPTEIDGKNDATPGRRWNTSGLEAKTTRLTIANARDGMHGQMTEAIVNRPVAENTVPDVAPAGLHWQVVDFDGIPEGSGIAHPELAAALLNQMDDDAVASGVGHKVVLSREEVAGFPEPIGQLFSDSYIKVGEFYFVPFAPEEETSEVERKEESGVVMFENEEEGTVVMKDEVKMKHMTLEEQEAEDEKLAKKRRRGCCGVVFTPFEELPDLTIMNPCQMETENSTRRRCLNLAVDPTLNSFFMLISVVHFLFALPEILQNIFMCNSMSEAAAAAEAQSSRIEKAQERACTAELPFFHHFLFLVSIPQGVFDLVASPGVEERPNSHASTDSGILAGGLLAGSNHQDHRIWLLGISLQNFDRPSRISYTIEFIMTTAIKRIQISVSKTRESI